ncbi:hypothetical protein [Arthrobacter bambusae]|uniref:Uncharacterized protein n=1 Tax=Arthrobacter bambusae TaxID=1338426 RepID=A0AAW8DH16_9MICC|nr:hypothetical protein [Arthrobacter bambusae]MDP9904786.1 hypothetical protein [Arthrobacter bambusae]MDQ0129602.1 hypothetical protein [Arthrobacter bambusae]MDQ0180785.1 hypothetical protein [Arthrobacter bambusae]
MSGISSPLPELWIDWCEVTSASPEVRDEDVLTLFARQAGASQKMLASLRLAEPEDQQLATAWPAGHRRDAGALRLLLRQGTARVNDPATFWIDRLRLRRLLFAGVLLAPASQGGLGLTRDQALGLTPASFAGLRSGVGVAEEERACPACAVWSWLEVLGANAGWSSAMVKSLAHRRDEPSEGHRHELDDPNPEWAEWTDCPNLLPSIDRWGYLGSFASMHRSSLSSLIGAMTWFIEAAPVLETAELQSSAPTRHISAEEEAAILARADELNARVAALLSDFG